MSSCRYTPASDPIFRKFPRWSGTVPAGFSVDFTGQMTDLTFQSGNCGVQFERLLPERSQAQHLISPNYPPTNEEVFEWLHLLSAILDAQKQFVMLELGAGYGYWSVAAACALQIKRPTLAFTLTAVEAEPKHFEWLGRHFANNGVPPESSQLIYAAVDRADSEVHFVAGHAGEWYGQAIVDNADYRQSDMPKARTIRIPSVSIETLLTGMEYVDYLDMDIQGAELPVIEAGIDAMTRCVRRAFVATHSAEIDQNLPEVFRSAGWYATSLYRCKSTAATPFGEITFVDGTQCWVNPAVR